MSEASRPLTETLSAMFDKSLQVYVSPSKIYEFVLLLLVWTGAIVFSIVALTQLGNIYTTGSGNTDFTETRGKAVKSCATFSLLAMLCLILVQFLTLRVALYAP